MPIKYRAVHSNKAWRRVGIHKTLSNAIDGKDGAKNLLSKKGRVADKWNQYGDVLAVFVWETGSENGYVYRLKPDNNSVIESSTVTTSNLEQIDNKGGVTSEYIEELFKSSGAPEQGDTSDIDASVDDRDASEVIGPANREHLYPDELTSNSQSYPEGMARQVVVNAYERNLSARKACIEHYGYSCQICSFDFWDKYGEVGQDFIHVHHTTPIASVGASYHIDPILDLIPVCPNCHAMLHRRDPPLSVEELKNKLQG